MGRGAAQLTAPQVPPSGRAVLDVVDAIPPGAVLSYGDVAVMVGLHSARQVGQILARYGHEVPWHRVVRSDGSIGTPKRIEQHSRLRAEGVAFVGGPGARRVDMQAARWDAGRGGRRGPGTTGSGGPAGAGEGSGGGALRWVGRSVSAKGVRERRFDIGRDGRTVPGLLWTPVGAKGPRPLVLIGHGAGNTKSEPYVVGLARRLVRHHGLAAVAIDGPVHGDRRTDGGVDGGMMFLDFAQVWANDPDVTENMRADWRATVDAVQQLPEVGDAPVGYWGLSMGTIFGLPVVASDARVAAAVLGCMGTGGPTDAVRDRIAADAAAISCPVLFLMQWDDEIFSRRTTLALFDALGTRDKRLHANVGSHVAVPADEMGASESFLARHLAWSQS